MRLFLLLSTGLLLLQGCTPSQQSMVETFHTAVSGDRDITVSDEYIRALPYSTMYLRLNDGQQIFVVLGYVEQEQSKWLTQDQAMIVTRNGRLLKTTGLHTNLLDVTPAAQDPLNTAFALHDGARWTRNIRWTEDDHYRSATLTSEFFSAGETVLHLAGEPVRSQIWHENVRSTTPERTWQNTFWIEAATGHVRRSEQTLGAGVVPVEMTFLKPAP